MTTHVRHFQHAGYFNGKNEFVPTRMTILSEVEGDKVKYQVAFCSRRDQYEKKVGREVAKKSPVFEVPISEMSFNAINEAILVDLVTNRKDIMPHAHATFAAMVEDELLATNSQLI